MKFGIDFHHDNLYVNSLARLFRTLAYPRCQEMFHSNVRRIAVHELDDRRERPECPAPPGVVILFTEYSSGLNKNGDSS